MEANEQYFHGSVHIPYKLLSTFQSVDETIMRDYSNKSDRAVQSSVVHYSFFSVNAKKQFCLNLTEVPLGTRLRRKK